MQGGGGTAVAARADVDVALAGCGGHTTGGSMRLSAIDRWVMLASSDDDAVCRRRRR